MPATRASSRAAAVWPPLSDDDNERCRQRFGRVPRTSAVPVPTRDEASWLAARRRGIGASEMAAVLAVPGAWHSPFALWWAKQEGWSTTPTDAMTIGTRLEPLIGDLFAERHPDVLLARPVTPLWRHASLPWMLATPDFLAVSVGEYGELVVEPVECKSDEGGRWGRRGSSEVPAHHEVQVMQQCAVFGAARGHVVRLAAKRVSEYVLPFGQAEAARVAGWVPVAEAFLASLADREPPPVDGHRATEEALQALWPAVEVDAEGESTVLGVDVATAVEFEAAHDALAEAKARFAAARNAVRLALGPAGAGVTPDGRVFVRRSQYERAGYTVGPTTVDEIRRVR